MKFGMWAALDQRIIDNAFANGASAVGLACEQKEILNIFFDSISKQKLLRNFVKKY